ncbi:MAG: hypothetical protein LBN40_01350 [Oscillospiraceae bacterium]|jgi:hypothetical protein|nr:hypothetical protein [Oscillospiraceae bacterium]
MTENFEKPYTSLFNGLTDTIDEMEVLLVRLKRLQIEAEERFINTGESKIALMTHAS